MNAGLHLQAGACHRSSHHLVASAVEASSVTMAFATEGGAAPTRERDRGFEPPFLQRGVWCEPTVLHGSGEARSRTQVVSVLM